VRTRSVVSAFALAVLAVVTSTALAAEPAAPRETVSPAFKEAIPNVPGKTITALVVTYAPGGKTPPHYHDSAFVVGYVLSGAIRSKIDNGEERVYRAGEHWTEQPGAHHVMSENASNTEPAKLLAIFIADRDEKNLVTFNQK
jgi:quercetin dioxygenase-like cupin family protein